MKRILILYLVFCAYQAQTSMLEFKTNNEGEKSFLEHPAVDFQSANKRGDVTPILTNLPTPEKWAWLDFGTHIGTHVMSVVDIDLDGSDEMIMATNAAGDGDANSLVILEADLTTVQCVIDLRVRAQDIHYSQMDLDPQLELTIATKHHILTIDGRTCVNQLTHIFPEPIDAIGLGDLDYNEIPDVVYSVSGNLYTAPVNDMSNLRQRLGFGGSRIIVEPLGRVSGDDIGVYTQTHTILRGDDLSTINELFNWRSQFLSFGDVNGDGSYEVLGLTEDFPPILKMVNMETNTVVSEFEIDFADVLRTQDINQDGQDEILLGNDQWGDVVVTDYLGNDLFRITNSNHGVSNLIVADLDGDQNKEVYFASGHSSTAPDHLYQADWLSETITWVSKDYDGPMQLSHGLLVDGNGTSSIAVSISETNSSSDEGGAVVIDIDSGVGSAIFQPIAVIGAEVTMVEVGKPNPSSSALKCLAGSYHTRGIACYDAVSGVEQWHVDNPDGNIHFMRMMDLDGDLSQELVTISRFGVINAYNALNGALTWQANDDLSGETYRGYNNVALLGSELWMLNNGNLHKINPSTGATIEILSAASLQAIDYADGQLFGAVEGVGFGVLNQNDLMLSQIIHPESNDISYLDVSEDGLAAFISTGDSGLPFSTGISQMNVTLISINGEFDPWQVGEMVAYDTNFPNLSNLYVSNRHSVRKYDLKGLIDLIFMDDFE